MAFAMPMMTLLTNQECGIVPSLMAVLVPILGGHSPLLFVLITLIVAAIMTNLLNNMVVIMVLIPILSGFAVASGVSAMVIVCMLIVCGYLAIILPAGSPLTAIMYANREWVNLKVGFMYGGLSLVIFVLVLFCVGFPLGNIIL